MIDDIVKSMKAQLYERATSPLPGVFILSWSLWNYRFLMLVLSSMPVTEKFDYIEKTLFPDYCTILWHGIAFPLLTTALIIFIYPFPARLVYGFWRNQQKKLKETQQKIEDETPLTHEDSRKIRRDAREIENRLDDLLKKKEQEIADLKRDLSDCNEKLNKKEQDITRLWEQLKEREIEVKELSDKQNVQAPSLPEEKTRSKSRVEFISPMLSPDEIETLKLFIDHTYIESHEIPKLLPEMKKIKRDVVFGELMKKGFLKTDRFGAYELSHEGKKYLIAQKLD